MTWFGDYYGYNPSSGHERVIKRRRSQRDGAPTTAQREQRQAFLDAREHRTVVLRTHPDAIRAPYASRQAIYLQDEDAIDTGWPLE